MSGLIEEIRSHALLATYAPRIVYVLSGGAAKGFCHLGMIEALERRGVKPDLIVGTSAGALFGSLYSHFGDMSGVYERIEEVLASDEFKAFEKRYFGDRRLENERIQGRLKRFLSALGGSLKSGMHLGLMLITSAMVSETDTSSVFDRIFRGVTFETLKIPFAAVSINLTEGAPAVFAFGQAGGGDGGRESFPTIPGRDGLVKAVKASCAIPFIFPAVEIDGHEYADGFIAANLPVREAKGLTAGREAMLACFDVSAPIEESEESLSPLELALRLLDLATRSKQAVDRELADILFTPVDKPYPWSSFSRYGEFVEEGRRHMTEERLLAFERVFMEKLLAGIGKERSFMRRHLALNRLKKIRTRTT